MDLNEVVLWETAIEVIFDVMESVGDDGSMTTHDLLTHMTSILNKTNVTEEE